jgi:hypothetical protein
VYKSFLSPNTEESPLAHAFRKELRRVLETAIDAKTKREELKAKRNLLFARFLKNPLDTHLALEIKIIDDLVAEWTEQMEPDREGLN